MYPEEYTAKGFRASAGAGSPCRHTAYVFVLLHHGSDASSWRRCCRTRLTVGYAEVQYVVSISAAGIVSWVVLRLAAVARCAPAGKGIREAGSKALEVCQNIGALRMVRAVMEQMGRCVDRPLGNCELQWPRWLCTHTAVCPGVCTAAAPLRRTASVLRMTKGS